MPDSDSPAPQAQRRLIVADVAPLDVDGIRTVLVGSALWLVAFVCLLPFYPRLSEEGRTWYLWACLAGFGLGMLGLAYCRVRRDRSQARAVDPDAIPPGA